MTLLWLLTLPLFWVSYFGFTRGAVTRHLGFLHFVYYFVGIYGSAHFIYTDRGGTNTAFLAAVIAYPFCVLAGMVIARLAAPRPLAGWGTITYDGREATLVWTVVGMFLIVFAVYLLSLGPDIPLLKALAGSDPRDVRLARYLATKGYTGAGVGGLRVWFWLPRVLLDYLAAFVVVFTYYRLRVTGRGGLRLLAVCTLMAVLAFTTTEKYPVVKLVLILALCHFNAVRPRLSWRTLTTALWLALLGLFVSGVVYGAANGYFAGSEGVAFLRAPWMIVGLGWELLASRGLVGQALPLYMIYDLIPRTMDFFGGITLPNPLGLIHYEPVALPPLIANAYVVSEPGVQASDPTVFFGELYANWGTAGAVAGMLVFGFVVQLVHQALAAPRRRRTAFDIAFFYLIMLYVADFAIGFIMIVYDERVLAFVGLYLARRFFIHDRVRPPTRASAAEGPPAIGTV